MSSAPKKSKNFRKKADNDDEDDGAHVVKPSSAASKRASTVLSFDLNGGDSDVKLKKSRASKAMQRRDTEEMDRRIKIQAAGQDFDSLIANAPSVGATRPKYDLDAFKSSQPRRSLQPEESSELPSDAEIFTLADQAVDDDDDDAEDEFIPLNVKSKYEALKQAKHRNREVRTSSVHDEDHFDPLQASNTRTQIQSALEHTQQTHRTYNEEDDEDDEWQSEQMKRATAHSVRYDTMTSSHTHSSGVTSHIRASTTTTSTRLDLLDLSSLQATLKDTCSQLTQQCSDAERGLTSLRSLLAATNAELQASSSRAQEEAQGFEWLQHMRQYSSDLVGCLRAKQALMGDLQEATLALLGGGLRKRRLWRLDQQEDALLAMRKEGRIMALGDYRPAGVLVEADKPVQTQVDEFGRERNSSDVYEGQVQHRAQLREARVQRKRTLRQLGSRRRQSMSWEDEEMVLRTDWDMSDSEANSMEERCAKLAQASALVFRDTADEYRYVDQILARFAEFREKYPSKYQTAYISTSLVEVLGILVRLDLLPHMAAFLLNSHAKTFSLADRAWFGAVTRYSEENELDARLMSNIAGDIMLPLVQQLIPHKFDPRSRSSNVAMVALMGSIRNLHPRAELFATVIQVITQEYEQEIRRLCIPMLTTAVQPSVDVLLFMRRQIAFASKLIAHLTLWLGYFSPEHIATLLWKLLYHRTQEAMHKLLMIVMMATASDAVDTSTFGYVLEGVCQYLATLAEVSGTFGSPGPQGLVSRIPSIVSESRRLRPAEAARQLSSLFV